MTEGQILVSSRESILELVLNRPEKLNALSGEMLGVLAAQTERFVTDPALRVMLIRANGKYFSAGVDLNGAMAPPDDLAGPMAFRQWYREGPGSLHPLLDRFEVIEKPIVVAHQGPCLGGAFELSLSCDFRLAAAGARYGLPETALGNIPGSGGVSRLTRLAGPQWARWFIMANLQMSAEKAGSIGLVHEVYPDAEFDEKTWTFCQHLARQPPETIGAAKLAIELAADLDRAQARNVERLTASGLYFGQEFQSLMAAMKARLAGKNKG
jgi:enoyl-CoA hydratase/carnithine racemase